MVSFEEAGRMLDEAAEALPQEIFEGLNGGVNLLPARKTDQNGLLVMGTYNVNQMGRYVEIYYGSFRAAHGQAGPDKWRRELTRTLKPELTHHIESLAGDPSPEKWAERHVAALLAGLCGAPAAGGRGGRGEALLAGGNGPHHPLGGDVEGRRPGAVVVARGHYQPADGAGGEAPAGLIGAAQLVLTVGEGDAEGLGKAVPEIVAGARLQGLAVVHHALDGVGVLRPGELLLLGLVAAYHGHGQLRLAQLGVYLQHLPRLLQGLLGRGVYRVPLLPEEFAPAQEGAGGLLPAQHAAPLVVEAGQVAPGVHHMAPVLAEERLAGGADAQPLRQLLAAAHGHPGALGGKALHMVLLLLQQALRYEHGHGDVDMPRLLEAPVEEGLYVLPDGVAVRPQYEQALHP